MLLQKERGGEMNFEQGVEIGVWVLKVKVKVKVKVIKGPVVVV